jgi:hypothetical protein
MLSRRRFLSAALALPSLALVPPAHTPAQTSTPATPVDPDLWRYLSLSPLSVANPTQAMPVIAGNQRLQADTLGFALPFDMNDDEQTHAWIQGTYNVTLPSSIMRNVFRPEWDELTGFDVTQITTGAEIGEPPSMVTFLSGTFDPTFIQAAQLVGGYKPLEIDGHTVMSLHETDEVDLTNTLQAMVLARMNNSTILDDGTLVYASTLDLIEQVLAPEATLSTLPEVERAMATLDVPLISSALLGPGNFLPGIPAEIFAPQAQDEVANFILAMQNQQPAPIVLAAIAGSTAGGPITLDDVAIDATPDPFGLVISQPTSETKFALVYATPDEAQTAAEQIMGRLATGSSMVNQQPWTELFSTWSAVPNPEQASVLVTIEWTDRPANTMALIFNRDLGFITG